MNNQMKKTFFTNAFFLGLIAFAGSAMADGRDGLKHWWKVKDLNGDGFLQANEVYDVMTVGAATPLVGEYLYQSTDTSIGAKPATIEKEVQFATLRKTVADDALHFNNPTNYDENGTVKMNYQAVRLPKAGSIGGKQATVFARFKWDGALIKESSNKGNYNYNITVYADNFNDSSGGGWRVGLRCYDSGTSGSFYPAIFCGSQEIGFHHSSSSVSSTQLIRKDKWVEIAWSFSFETREDGEYVTPTAVIRTRDPVENETGEGWRRHTFVTKTPVKYTSNWSMYSGSVFPAYLGFHKRGTGVGGTDDFASAATGDDSFRGAIHEVRVYNRSMSVNEMLQCMEESDPLYTVGSRNGSADEFTDSEAEEVYEPATMPLKNMRRTLNAAHPTAAVKFDVPEDGHGLARLVELKLLPGTGFTGGRLDVAANGRIFGSLTIPEDGDMRFQIPARIMSALVKDEETGRYPLTLTFTRKESLVGDLLIDSLYVGAGWQLGASDHSDAGFGGTGYYNYCYKMGDTNTAHFVGDIYNQGLYKNQDLYFAVSDWAATNCAFRLTTKSIGSQNAPVSLYLNDTTTPVAELAAGTLNTDYVYNIPAGALLGGNNLLRFSAGGTDIWVSLDYVRLEAIMPEGFRNRDTGLMLLFR